MAFTVDFLLQRFEEQGLFNIILPLLLVFAIVYGILGKIQLFNNDKINAIIAFVMGMYVTVFSEFAFFLTNITAGGMVILVGLLFFMMIVGFGSSLSGGSPTSILSDHKDAMTIVLMLFGGIIFVNSGGLLIVGGYSVRIGLIDVFQLTGLYVAFVVVKSLLGLGNGSYNSVKKLEDRYTQIVRQIDALGGGTDADTVAEIKRLNDEKTKIENKLGKKGVSPDQIKRMQDGDPIFRRRYGRYGRYGHHYDDY
ncbi:MAG: hypothetical protein K0B07_02035 [DPANN group archaeon]|nr:hypothetical protein [DPANN group archaeon]